MRRGQHCQSRTAASTTMTVAPTSKAVPIQPSNIIDKPPSISAMALRIRTERYGQTVLFAVAIGVLLIAGECFCSRLGVLHSTIDATVAGARRLTCPLEIEGLTARTRSARRNTR